MVHLIYLILVIGTISNALLVPRIRLNKRYHLFEIVTVLSYITFGVLVGLYGFDLIIRWAIIAAFLRFGLYAPIWGKVAYNDWRYLGDKAWTDKVLKWLFYDVMNQGKGSILFLNFLAVAFAIMMYLNLVI